MYEHHVRRSLRRKHGEFVAVRGVVTRLFVSRPRYSAGRFRTSDGEELDFSGRFMTAVGDPLRLDGQWVFNSRFGPRLEVTSLEFDVASVESDAEKR